MKILDIEQGSTQWHELRRNHIGASNCAAILGKSKWKTPYQVYEEMTFGTKVEKNAAMQHGIDNEPIARDMISERHNVQFKPIVAQSDDRDWQIASLDGWDGERILEIKCPGNKVMDEILENGIPSDYLWQMQHQLAVTNAKGGYFLAWQHDRSHELCVDRDEAMISELNAKEEAFYRDHLLTFTPPPLTDRDIIVRLDVQFMFAETEWKQANEALVEAKKREEAAREKLIEMAAGNCCRGSYLSMTKYQRNGAVDYASIPELKGIDLAPYRKPPIQVWKITEDKTAGN